MAPTQPPGPGGSEAPATPSPEAEDLARRLEIEGLKKKLDELSLPWWRRAGTVTIVTSILASVVPATEAIKGWVESRRARVVETENRIETVRSGYLDRSLKQGTNQERAAILRFILATSSDDALAKWAQTEMELVKQQVEDERKFRETQIQQQEKAREAVAVAANLPRVRASQDSQQPTPEEQRAREELKKIRASADELNRSQDTILAGLKLPPATFSLHGPPFRPVILWVDDHPENNTGLRYALEAAGARVVISTSTEDAERLLIQERVDLIISDMGRGDRPRAGYDLLDSLRTRGSTTPFVIFSSGGSDAANRAEAVRHKANGSTNYPAELLRIVGSHLDLELRLPVR